MNELQAVSGTVVGISPDLIGFILPPIIEYLNKDVKTEREKFIVTLLLCFLIAFISNWQKLTSRASWMSIEEMLESFAFIFIQSQIVYNLYFKKSLLRAKLIDKITPDDTNLVIPSRVVEAVPPTK
jgi:hypothetical protein